MITKWIKIASVPLLLLSLALLQGCDSYSPLDLIGRVIENFDGKNIYASSKRDPEKLEESYSVPSSGNHYLGCFDQMNSQPCLSVIHQDVIASYPALKAFIDRQRSDNQEVNIYAMHVTADQRFVLIGYFAGHDFAYVIRQLKGDEYVTLDGLPVFSPDDSKVLVFNTDLDAGYNPTIFDVYERYGNYYQLVFKGINEHDEWGAENPRWLNESTLQFTELRFNNDLSSQDMYVRTEKVLKNDSGRWLIE